MLQEAVDVRASHETLVEAAKAMGLAPSTYNSRLIVAAQEGIQPRHFQRKAEVMDIPEGIQDKHATLEITGEHRVLIISDVHVPYHDKEALTIALDEGQKRECDVVLINGDFLDAEAASQHEKIPNQRYGFHDKEIPMAQEILKAIRKRFPSARIIYKEGNHEFRIPRTLAKYTPDLYKRDALLDYLHPQIYDIEFVFQETDIKMGHLNVIHGHEYRGGGAINVARSLFLKAADNVLTGHYHRSQEYIHRTLDGKVIGAWSVGCLSDLTPSYMMKNQWNLGFAVVHLKADKNFVVENKKIIKGTVY